MKRLFLQKAHTHKPKHPIANQLMSEKYDGIRAFWDGGASRGLYTDEVPYANTTKDTKRHIATGLWSMNAKAIYAPDWWLNDLPAFPLDGELWSGRGNHQATKSAVSTHIPNDDRWKPVRYMVFDSPNLGDILFDGTINTTTHKAELIGCEDWLYDRGYTWEHKWNLYEGDYSFHNTLEYLKANLRPTLNLQLVSQEYVTDPEQANVRLREVLANNGEGIVLRDESAAYEAGRSHNVTKWKPYIDDEGIATGLYKTGRETELGSKLLGLMGALEITWRGKTFLLSGFTDVERSLVTVDGNSYRAFNWACNNPDSWGIASILPKHFPKGTKVTFKYRELTDDGIPKEASFLRTRFDLEG